MFKETTPALIKLPTTFLHLGTHASEIVQRATERVLWSDDACEFKHSHAFLCRLLYSLTSDETRQGAYNGAHAVLEAVGHVVILTVLNMVVGTLVVMVMVVDASVNAVEVAVPLLGGVEVLRRVSICTARRPWGDLRRYSGNGSGSLGSSH